MYVSLCFQIELALERIGRILGNVFVSDISGALDKLPKWPWRGAPLLPTRPKGTGLASLSSGCHHAAAAAQSSPGDVGSPAFAADDSSEDALAVHNARIRKDTRSCTTTCAGALRPPAHPTAHSHAQGKRVASTVGTRRRPHAVA